MVNQPYSLTGKYVENLKTTQNSTKEEDSQIYSKYVPKNIQNSWKKLFSKQLYGIGKDIMYNKNLLLQYGFTKLRPPNPEKGSSQYTLTGKNDQIILWGFGMVFATKNKGLFLWRHEFVPKLLDVNTLSSQVWAPEQLPQCTIPKTPDEMLLTLQLLFKSMKWLEGYEKWIIATCGQSYRDKSLQAANSSNVTSFYLDQKWSELNKKFEKILTNSEPEQNYDVIESEPVQPNFEHPIVIPEKICGPCGDMYPENGEFCPSCGWEDLPC